MVSIRDHMRKFSSRAFNKFKPSEIPHGQPEQTPGQPATEAPAGRLDLPKDPKLVRKDVHDGAPTFLPAPAASQEEVQYFVYAVLTTKIFGCAKVCPQWVLETCWNCDKTGAEFLALTDEDVMTMCPMTSRMYPLANADQRRWNVEQMPSPHARELIGKAILAVLKDRRKTRSSQKDQIQRYWDAERFRDRANHGPNGGLFQQPPNPLPPLVWSGATGNFVNGVGQSRPWYSKESTSTAATTISVSETPSNGTHDQSTVKNHVTDPVSPSKLAGVRRVGSLRVKGSAPVLRAKEAFRPATLRSRPTGLPSMFEDEAESTPVPERKNTPAPSLTIEIPNGHMSMDFSVDPLQLQSYAFGQNARSHGSTSSTSPPSPRTSSKQSKQHPPEQPNLALTQFAPAAQRAWPLRNTVYSGCQPVPGTQPPIGVEIGHSHILGTQYAPGTAITYPSLTIVPPQNVQPPSVGLPSLVNNFDTTVTRHWPPHRVVFPSGSQSTLPSVKSVEVVAPSNTRASSVTGGTSPALPEETVAAASADK